MGKLICIFGNSHMSAPAMSGLNSEFAARGDELHYWGLAGSSFPNFSYENGRIISPWPDATRRISDWCEHLDLTRIDTLVCYGFHFSPSYLTRSIMRMQQKHCGLSVAVRSAVTDAMLNQWWEEQSGHRLIKEIRHDFPDMEIICYTHPHVAEGFGFYESGDEDLARELQRIVLEFIKEKVSAFRVDFRPQPDATVVSELYTAREFNAGAIKYGTKGEQHENDDFRHMNAAYGDHILQDLLALTA